jgi:hypothetical protein
MVPRMKATSALAAMVERGPMYHGARPAHLAKGQR